MELPLISAALTCVAECAPACSACARQGLLTNCPAVFKHGERHNRCYESMLLVGGAFTVL